jgi:hypothetical protein
MCIMFTRACIQQPSPLLACCPPTPTPTPTKSKTNDPPSLPLTLRAGDDHSLLRLCCDLYALTGKPWLFELETVAIILNYKW